MSCSPSTETCAVAIEVHSCQWGGAGYARVTIASDTCGAAALCTVSKAQLLRCAIERYTGPSDDLIIVMA